MSNCPSILVSLHFSSAPIISLIIALPWCLEGKYMYARCNKFSSLVYVFPQTGGVTEYLLLNLDKIILPKQNWHWPYYQKKQHFQRTWISFAHHVSESDTLQENREDETKFFLSSRCRPNTETVPTRTNQAGFSEDACFAEHFCGEKREEALETAFR